MATPKLEKKPPQGTLTLFINHKIIYQVNCQILFRPFSHNYIEGSVLDPYIIWNNSKPQRINFSPSEYSSNASPIRFTSFYSDDVFKIKEQILEFNELKIFPRLEEFLEKNKPQIISYFQQNSSTLSIMTKNGLINCNKEYCWLQIDFQRESLNGRLVAAFGDTVFVLDNGDVY